MSIGNPIKLGRLKRRTELEAENARLRKMAANLTAHVQSLKAALGTSSARTGVAGKNTARGLQGVLHVASRQIERP
jgi:hypothetical protein